MSAQTLTEMRMLLRRHGLKPRASLGQHFLADPNLTRRIVTTAGVGSGDQVLRSVRAPALSPVSWSQPEPALRQLRSTSTSGRFWKKRWRGLP